MDPRLRDITGDYKKQPYTRSNIRNECSSARYIMGVDMYNVHNVTANSCFVNNQTIESMFSDAKLIIPINIMFNN